MAASARWVLCLCLGWGCLCPVLGDALKAGWDGLRRQASPGGVRGGRAGAAAGDYGPGQWQEPEERRRPERLQPGDKVSEHMLRLYDQYSGGRAAAAQPQDLLGPPGLQLRHGNTVRGFRPRAAGESQCRVRGDPDSSGSPRNPSVQSCRGSRPAAGPGLPVPQGRARLLPRSSQSRGAGEGRGGLPAGELGPEQTNPGAEAARSEATRCRQIGSRSANAAVHSHPCEWRQPCAPVSGTAALATGERDVGKEMRKGLGK